MYRYHGHGTRQPRFLTGSFTGITLYRGLSKDQEVGFTPVTKVTKIYCCFLGPFWCNKQVYPEGQVSCGSNELLVNNVAHQMNKKLMIQNKFYFFLHNYLFFNLFLFTAQNNKNKQLLRKTVDSFFPTGVLPMFYINLQI